MKRTNPNSHPGDCSSQSELKSIYCVFIWKVSQMIFLYLFIFLIPIASLADIVNLPGTEIIIEAETGLTTAPITIGSDSNASGTQYVFSPSKDQGHLSLSVNILNAGNYILWGRTLSPSYSNDSFYVSVDNSAEEIWDTAENIQSPQWQWTRVTKRINGQPVDKNLLPWVFSLTQGVHTFTFRGRDVNTLLDQLILTQDTNYVPQGILKGNKSFYASPTGLPTNTGLQSSPWDLQTALCGGRSYVKRGNGWPQCNSNEASKVMPGDVIWLRAGTYGQGGATLFQSRLQGTKDKPIIVKAYPNERATINGGISEALLSEPIDNYARYVWYWGFEITNTSTERVVALTNIDSMTVGGRPAGLELYGEGNKAINLVIHDVGHPGIGFWKGVGDGGEINGVLMWGCGLDDTGTVYTLAGSGIYAQNNVGTRYIKDVISFREFTTGFKIYGNGTDGFQVEGNVLFNNHQLNLEVIPNGSDNTERLVIRNNYTYRPKEDGLTGVLIGKRAVYPGPEFLYDEGKDVLLQNNYFVVGDFDPWPDPYGEYPGPPIWIDDFSDVTVTNNTFIGGNLTQWAKLTNTTGLWDNNRYFSLRAANDPDKPFVYIPAPRETTKTNQYYFNDWKNDCNCDRNSTAVNGYPTENLITVRPNQYEKGRAHIIVYNWQKLPSVNVDLSNIGLQVGDRFEIRDAQNFLGPVIYTGIYTATPISLPTQLTSVSRYIGNLNPFRSYQLAHTPLEFNVFVVLRTSPTPLDLGDVSGDGKISVYDAAIVLRFTMGGSLSDTQKVKADYNLDGNIDTADVIAIAKKAMGL